MAVASPPTAPPRVLVLYGSETGTAQDVAEQIQQQAWNRQLVDTQCAAMDAFPVARELPLCSIVVFVVSTTGDGDAPENMRSAWRSLLRKTLAKDWLQGVQIAVFGLGDSSYAKYNAVARRLQARLLQLGTTEIIERGLGDDQHALGLFGALNPWLEKLWAAVLLQFPLPEGFVVNDAPRAIEPRYKLEVQSPDSVIAGSATEWVPRSDTSSFYAPPSNALHQERGIVKAKLVENRRLTAADWKQDVRHLVFDLGEGDIQYPAGSIAVVYPENVNGVDELLAYVGLPGDSTMTILVTDGSPQFDFPTNTTIRDLFAKYLDIQGTPRRTFFARLSLFASNEEEREKLEEIASPEGADLLYDYCIREKKTYVEVLLDFPSVRVPLELLVQYIPPLKPRAYSISSSSLAHPGQLHLTVAIVDFLTPYKRRRGGVCSAFFQTLDPTKNEIYLPLWLKTGLFHPPSIAKDMILIGPGTGLAAMRAIAQERQLLRAGLEDATIAGKTVLYFGSRHQQKDYLYGDELEAMAASGALTSLHTAFSRDQSHKVYVQTRLAEQKDEVFHLLTSGAYVYIAGSAKRMPSDVYEVLRDILRSVGKLSLQEAEIAMKALVRTKRSTRMCANRHQPSAFFLNMPSAMAEVTAAAAQSTVTVSPSRYHSKLRAKREERLEQQQQRQPQEIHHTEPSTFPDVHGTATVVGLGSSECPILASLDTASPPTATAFSTSRTTARSFAAEDARRRERADARRLLIEFPGTVWDVVRTNDMTMLRNFFLVEGAAKMVRAHSKQADEFGRTLLHTAAWWGRVDIAKYLISNGATLNEIDSVTTRLTPLMDAARAGHPEIGLLLLEHEADVTLRDASGDNAFHWAARHSRGTFLLQMSLKLLPLDRALLVSLWTAKNPRGRTPVDYIRAHPTVFPMICKRLGTHVPLHRTTGSSTHRRRRSASGHTSDGTRVHADASAANPTLDSDGSRPATAQSDAVPLSGVDALGLDVGTFAYKSRDAVLSR